MGQRLWTVRALVRLRVPRLQKVPHDGGGALFSGVQWRAPLPGPGTGCCDFPRCCSDGHRAPICRTAAAVNVQPRGSGGGTCAPAGDCSRTGPQTALRDQNLAETLATHCALPPLAPVLHQLSEAWIGCPRVQSVSGNRACCLFWLRVGAPQMAAPGAAGPMRQYRAAGARALSLPRMIRLKAPAEG